MPSWFRVRVRTVTMPACGREDDSRFAAFVEMGSALPAPQPVVLQQMRACAEHDTHERLGQISLPTLVIHGDADPLVPIENGRFLAEHISGARLIVYERVGHIPEVEVDERFNADLLAFLP